jgi:hypothetical protein
MCQKHLLGKIQNPSLLRIAGYNINIKIPLAVDNHVPSSKFNRSNHTVGLVLSRNRREVS